MKLIVGRGGPDHVALDTVREFEKAILCDARIEPDSRFGELASGAAYGAWKLTNRFGWGVESTSWLMSRSPAGPRAYLAVLMGPMFRKCLPHFSFPGRKSIYLFDAWPDAQPAIVRFVEQFGVADVFVSSSQAAAQLAAMFSRARCSWVPEGLNPAEYGAKAPSERDIDVLAMGRRYDAHHDRIVEALARADRRYLYERIKGQVIFPERRAFIDGLARSKISICVPSNITHPARAGGIETMTVRYLQSMAAKCLIVGKAPAELVQLFGYNPVVEIDEFDPAGQLAAILEDFASFQPLIDRNREVLLQGHTWQHRWTQVSELLSLA